MVMGKIFSNLYRVDIGAEVKILELAKQLDSTYDMSISTENIGIYVPTKESIEANITHGKLRFIYRLCIDKESIKLDKLLDYPTHVPSDVTEESFFEKLREETNGNIYPGCWYVTKNGHIGQIISYGVVERDANNNSTWDPLNKGLKEHVGMISYICETHMEYRISMDNDFIWPDNTVPKSTPYSKDFFERRMVLPRNTALRYDKTDLITIFNNMENLLNGHASTILELPQSDDGKSQLIHVGSKEQLLAMKSNMETKKYDMLAYQYMMGRTVTLMREEMENKLSEQKNRMSAIITEMNLKMAIMKKEIKKIMKLVVTLEIYMGISEDLVQIQEGENAPDEEPIHLRQMVIYMDEEWGNYKDGGMDFNDIPEFEEWMVSTKAYETILPEKKGVVVLRPRRRDKDRGKLHPLLKVKLEEQDKKTYVFCRNGDNLYRIYTSNADSIDRLFPKRDELSEMYENMESIKNELLKQDSTYYIDSYVDKMEKIEDQYHYYRKNMMLLFGITHRTNVFGNLPMGFSLLDPSKHYGHVNFIYDEEMIITDGRKSYNQWLHDINSQLKVGSRVYIVGSMMSLGCSDFTHNVYNDHNIPKNPQNGVYQLKEHKTVRTVTKKAVISDLELQSNAMEMKLKKDAYLKDLTDGKITHKQYNSLCEDADWNLYRVHRTFSKDGEKYHEIEVKSDEKYRGYKSEDVIINQIKITYNPKDTVYAPWGGWSDGEWSRERKTNVGLIIDTNANYLINYDALLLDDIEYYTKDRVNRKHYLNMLPILHGLKFELLKEMAEEKEFINSMSYKYSTTYNIEHDVVENVIRDCVKWWKDELPTVWKRPIKSNDAKAWKAISNKVDIILKKMGMGVEPKKHKAYRFKSGHVWYTKEMTKNEFVNVIHSSIPSTTKKSISDSIFNVGDEDVKSDWNIVVDYIRKLHK